jgi:hypothetical protein
MTLKPLAVLLLLTHPAIPQATETPTPQALVTIYSTGSFWKGGIPGNKHGMFAGRIFDEYDKLAQLRPGHYVTFKLSPGLHTLSAGPWFGTAPTAAHLEINLVANQHYYIGTYLESEIVLSTFHIEQRTCLEAQHDNLKSTPLDPKHLEKYGKTVYVADTTFPTCPTPTPDSPPATATHPPTPPPQSPNAPPAGAPRP